MNEEEKKCYDYEIVQDSAGRVILARKCFCNSTACLQEWNRPITLPLSIEPECNCEESVEKYGSLCSKCRDRFYENVFKTKLI